jgi:hypothetical protein
MIEHGEYNPTPLQLLRIAAALGLKLGPVVSRAQREWKAQKTDHYQIAETALVGVVQGW